MSFSVVFLGTSAFAVPSLKALAADERFDVRLIITQPDRPVGRKQLLTAPPVKIAALELGLTVLQPEKLNADFQSPKSQVPSPDFLIVVSYGQILSEQVLAWPKIAAVNVHASLLPKLRGASPLQHAILEGMRETGVTIQNMVKELDAGAILNQETMTLDSRETFQSLHDTLAKTGAALLIRTLVSSLHPKEQDHSQATFCKKLRSSDGIVDPINMTADEIDRRVRALNPWPGVRYGNAKILAASLTETSDSFALPCAEHSTLFVTSIRRDGGKTMTGKAYALGHSSPKDA